MWLEFQYIKPMGISRELTAPRAYYHWDHKISFAPTATLAPLQYIELLVATLFGYLVFQNFPSTLRLTGIAIIIGAGLYIIHRERVIAEQLITALAASPIRCVKCSPE